MKNTSYSLADCIRLIEKKLNNQSEIALAWKKYISQEDYEIEVDEQIYGDWQRVRSLGVNHETIPKFFITDEELNKRLAKIEPIMTLIRSSMQSIFRALSPFHKLINMKFYDKDRILLYSLSDENTLKLMNQMGLKTGSIMQERYWGNNGAGTCLFYQRPIAIVGQEHYLEIFKPWICFDYPVRDEEGNLVGGIDLALPIDNANPLTMALLDAEVRSLEEQIKESRLRESLAKDFQAMEHFYKQIINKVRQGVIVLDKDDGVLIANDFAVKLFPVLDNWEREGKSIKTVPLIDQCFQRKGNLDNIKIAFEGNFYLVSMFGFENNFTPSQYRVLFINDVTELERYEEQSHYNDKLALVGNIAAGLAHELRNPLTAVRGFIQLDLAKDCLPEEVRRHLSVCLEEIDRTNKLISDFLLLGRPSKEKKEKISLEELLENSLELCEHRIIKNNINVLMNFSQQECYIYGNRDKLIQVFLNVISNAIDAMDKATTRQLIISTVAWQECFKVIISDSGMGVLDDDLLKIGTPFFTTKDSGTGLGLSIARSIINSHNGKLEIEPQNIGCCVTILLPSC